MTKHASIGSALLLLPSFLLFFFFSSLLFFFSSSLPACIPPQQPCLSLPDESSFTCFLSGMILMTNSRNCTCQQSSVNRRDQCVCTKVSVHNNTLKKIASRLFEVLYAYGKNFHPLVASDCCSILPNQTYVRWFVK